MRVAHIINSLTKASGLSTFCSNMSLYLAEMGVEVDLYVWWVGDDALIPKHKLITVYETKDSGFKPDIKPNIVHVHSLWVPIAHQGCVYARKNKIPYILSPHGMLSSWALQYKWWKKLPVMILYQYRDLSKACMLHATAQSEVQNIRRLCLQQDVAIVPLGTELPPFEVAKMAELRNKNYIRTVLFLSRIHPVKGLKNLFNAWATVKHNQYEEMQKSDLQNDFIHWRLVVAGPDALGHKKELLRHAQSLQLNVCDWYDSFKISDFNRIETDVDIVFTGPVYEENKNQLHALADLFVLPSFTENFGAVISDSLAYSVPVITTKGTPWKELEGWEIMVNKNKTNSKIDEILISGWCGWWIDIGVEPLAKALDEAMKMTDEERRAMGENGRKLIANKYTWHAVSGEMLKAYEQILSVE